MSIFPHMSHRLVKKWIPRDAEGSVTLNANFEELPLFKHKWMILTRTNKMLERLRDYLYSMNYRFEAKAQELLPKKMLNAYRVWKRLHEGAVVNKEDVKDLWDFLTVKQGHITRGFASGKTLESIEQIDLDGLRSEHGLLASGSWEQLNFPESSKLYLSLIHISEPTRPY